MLNIEYQILRLLSKEAYTVDQIKAKMQKFNEFRIENTIDDLEEAGYLQELFDKELSGLKTQNIEALEGNMGKGTGYYLDTKYGIAAYEEEKSERFRFYAPFIFSALISIMTVIISAVSLYFSLSDSPIQVQIRCIR